MEMIKTTWTKEQVQEMIDREKLAYQKIDLPYGLSTGQGNDRSITSEKIFADSIKGKSVLDIGCSLGFFCQEAVRQGASRVIGVDADDERLRKAALIADCVGMARNIEFRQLDINTEDLTEQYDIILLLNVLHHIRNPIAVLDKLIAHTKQRLILEVVSPSSPKLKNTLKSMGYSWWTRRKFEKMPLIFVKKGGAAAKTNEEIFHFTAPAVNELLMEHRGCFARLDLLKSFKNHYIAIAWKRQVDNLVIIGGTASSGKTTFIDSIKRGELSEIASQIGINIKDNWTYTDAEDIKSIKKEKIQNVVYHYDILRTFDSTSYRYSIEQGMDIVDCASRRKVVTLWCDPQVLRQRLPSTANNDQRHWRQLRISNVMELYQNEKLLAQQYQKWLEFCQQKGVQLFFVDCTSRPRLMSHSEWDQKIKDLMERV